ncbi:MAG: L-lactate dehydrogenase [Chloroflexota bacterium]|nr:L-lactate dehydrogenase [Chloroflexota bacterium]
MKLTVVGGAGRVGSTTLFQLLLSGAFHELVVLDIAKEAAEGEALDLRHGMALSHRCVVRAGDYDASEGSDFVVITAGIPRQPGETRLDLLKKNVDLMKGVLEQVMKHNRDPFIIMVANPVDVLTYQAIKSTGLPINKVMGTGTLLDTTRFRSLLGERLGVTPDQVYVYMLGEHGDSQAPVTSTGTVAGIPLRQFPGFSERMLAEVIEATRFGGADVIKRKRGTFYAVAPMIVEFVRAIQRDEKRVLPISSLMEGSYLGIKDVALSVPCVIGAGGREQLVPLELSEDERAALQNSAKVLREAIEEVGL